MAVKNLKKVLSVPQLYTLADTLGVPLTLTKGIITGDANYEIELPGLGNFGFPVSLKVVASFHNKDCTLIGLLCESIGELAVLICHDIKASMLWLSLVDTSKVSPSWAVAVNNVKDVKTLVGARRKFTGAIERNFTKAENSGAWDLES